MFGIDPKVIQWMAATVKWLVAAMQQIAAKLGVTLPDPPAQP